MPLLNYFSLLYGLLFLSALVFCFFLNIILLKFVKTLGVKNQSVEKIRWTNQVKPTTGGIGFYLIILLSIITHFILFTEGVITFNKPFIGLISVISMAFLMGFADDAYNTTPWFKLFIQTLCAILLIYTNTYITISNLSFINYLLTILWVVSIMNAINMLDNMDGIAGILSLCIVILLTIINTLQNGLVNINNTILISLGAALISFLFFNWHPSKIYMGDTGSQLLGISLATISINLIWNNETFGSKSTIKPFVMAFFVFMLPILDASIVIIKRLLKKQPPFIGGKDHTTHHLSFLGLSDTMICLFIVLIYLISGSIVICFQTSILVFNPLGITIIIFYGLLVSSFLAYNTLKKTYK